MKNKKTKRKRLSPASTIPDSTSGFQPPNLPPTRESRPPVRDSFFGEQFVIMHNAITHAYKVTIDCYLYMVECLTLEKLVRQIELQLTFARPHYN